MSVSTLEVDGKTITATAGQTIFDAAWDSGIHIPRLCHLGGLSDVGACRLCLVEIDGTKEAAALVPHQSRRGHGGADQYAAACVNTAN